MRSESNVGEKPNMKGEVPRVKNREKKKKNRTIRKKTKGIFSLTLEKRGLPTPFTVPQS